MSFALQIPAEVKKLDDCPSRTAGVGASQSRRLLIRDNTNNIRFLIDTGSDVSIVPATSKDRKKPPTNFVLHAANNTSIKTYDSRFLYVDLGLRRRFSWRFLVADVTTAIIGADFLSFFALSVNLKNRHIVDETTKLTSTGGMVSPTLFGITTVDYNHPFRELLENYPEITRPCTMRMEVSHNVTHHIVTKGPPVASKARRLPPDKLKAAQQEFQLMMELGICRRSSSSWARIMLPPRISIRFRTYMIYSTRSMVSQFSVLWI